jgi:membrane-associated protease RseP (regulator of RpoE activity)
VKLLYKPVGLVAGILAGMVAGVVFKRAWSLVGGDEGKPNPTDKERGWVEVVSAAALQGAVLGGVKAAVDRASAQGYEAVTGVWPGKTQEPDEK